MGTKMKDNWRIVHHLIEAIDQYLSSAGYSEHSKILIEARADAANSVMPELRDVQAEAAVFRALTEVAMALLCSAAPSKVLNDEQQKEWCKAFGKWFAEASHELWSTQNERKRDEQ